MPIMILTPTPPPGGAGGIIIENYVRENEFYIIVKSNIACFGHLSICYVPTVTIGIANTLAYSFVRFDKFVIHSKSMEIIYDRREWVAW